jgi:hypothetical protein
VDAGQRALLRRNRERFGQGGDHGEEALGGLQHLAAHHARMGGVGRDAGGLQPLGQL